MGSSNNEDLSKYIKTVYTAEDATPLGSRVSIHHDSAELKLKRILQELKKLRQNQDKNEIFEWIESTIKSLEGAPALNNLIQKVKSS